MRSFARETLPLTKKPCSVGNATAVWTCLLLRTSPPLYWSFRRSRRKNPTSCCPISGCRRKPYRYGLPVTMSPMTAGNNRDTCKPQKAMLSTTGTSNGSLMLWGRNSTSKKLHMTVGERCRWYRTLRGWDLL